MKNLFQYKIVFFIFFLFFVQFNSQDTKIDDLNNETIEKKIDSLHNNPNKAWEIINLYIKKSKKKKIMNHYFMHIDMHVTFLSIQKI